MGIVYLARQTELNRLVAIKMINKNIHTSPEYLQRFAIEAKAAGKLNHPHIVEIYDVGRVGNFPYLAFEYMDGGTLLEKIREKPLEPIDAASLLVPVAQAVHYAHNKSVIHRDLKPSNILLTVDGVPKVSDFGLAKDLESEHQPSISGDIIGTPNYMAPEQAMQEDQIGHAVDIYALGAILYCALTGRPPFVGTKQSDVLIQVVSKDPVSPRTLQPTIPIDLETICLKCLQRDPKARYETAQDLANDLSLFLNGEPIKARPVGSLSERFVGADASHDKPYWLARCVCWRALS